MSQNHQSHSGDTASPQADLSFAQSLEQVLTTLERLGKDDLASRLKSEMSLEIEVGSPTDQLPVGLQPMRIEKPLDRIYLSDKVSTVVRDFLQEQRSAEMLREMGETPRNKLLMMGPPGNGKTALAGAIMAELGYRPYLVQYASLISSKPGETAKGLEKVLRFAARQPTTLFFDEFDAIAIKRTSEKEEGDMKRTVSTLLTLLDSVPDHVVCIAATNHPELLDSAIFRRFNMRLELGKPDRSEFVRFMRERFKEKGFDVKEGEIAPHTVDFEIADARMQLENLSDAQLFCSNVIRHFTLHEKKKPIEICINEQFRRWPEEQKKRSL